MGAILTIDTASPVLAVALDDGSDVRTVVRECAADHSRMLLPAVEELLGQPGAALDGIVVVTGPGSYAGVRVGVATATALAMARGCGLAGVPTFEALAAAAGSGSWTLIHPAGRGTFAVCEARDGRLAGGLRSARAQDLAGLRLAGEGAASLGGQEVGAGERVQAALSLGRERLRDGRTAPEVVYLREPYITVPRRRAAG